MIPPDPRYNWRLIEAALGLLWFAILLAILLRCTGCCSKYARRGDYARAPGFKQGVHDAVNPRLLSMAAATDKRVEAVKGDAARDRDKLWKVLLVLGIGGAGIGGTDLAHRIGKNRNGNGKTNGGTA